MTELHAAVPFRQWIVEKAKITDYLLNPTHPKGASKARLLMQFGFTAADPDGLAEKIALHAIGHGPGRDMFPPGGHPPRIVIDGPMETPSGRYLNVRIVWEQQAPDEARFLTLYPLPAAF